MDVKKILKEQVYEILEQQVELAEIVIEKPKDDKMGDLAIPCFIFSKKLRKSPMEIAQTIKNQLSGDLFEQVDAVGGYLNIFLKRDVIIKSILNKIMTEAANYGNNDIGKEKTVVVEYSSPNIAKPFGVGHLRTTIIGDSLKYIFKKNGYNVHTINYLGDYGTQFGKLLYQYVNYGNEEAVLKNPIQELKRLYVEFHEMAKENPELEDEGRKWFKKLEDNDEEAVRLWTWFKEESLKEFRKTYDLLDINDFDEWSGEASYKSSVANTVQVLEEKGLLEDGENASKIVPIGDDVPPALILKSDGTSIYLARDLSAYMDRKNRYKFDEILYVVGSEQSLHFEQLKRVIKKMDYDETELRHIDFGLVLQDGKKMSTRGGKTFNLQDLLEEAVNLAHKYIEEKNPSLEDKEQISTIVGVGAIKFNDLKNYRSNNIEFNLEEALRFEGNTGPYIQYTNARICSLIQNLVSSDNYSIIDNDYVWRTVMDLYEFEEVVKKACTMYDPSLIAKLLLDISSDFNKLYANDKFISENQGKTNFYLLFSKCVGTVLTEGMRLLGIKMVNKM